MVRQPLQRRIDGPAVQGRVSKPGEALEMIAEAAFQRTEALLDKSPRTQRLAGATTKLLELDSRGKDRIKTSRWGDELHTVSLTISGEDGLGSVAFFITAGGVADKMPPNQPFDVEINGGNPQLLWTPGRPVAVRGNTHVDPTGAIDLRFEPPKRLSGEQRQVLSAIAPLFALLPEASSPEEKAIVAFLRALPSSCK
jgi:hypothetical protein